MRKISRLVKSEDIEQKRYEVIEKFNNYIDNLGEKLLGKYFENCCSSEMIHFNDEKDFPYDYKYMFFDGYISILEASRILGISLTEDEIDLLENKLGKYSIDDGAIYLDCTKNNVSAEIDDWAEDITQTNNNNFSKKINNILNGMEKNLKIFVDEVDKKVLELQKDIL